MTYNLSITLNFTVNGKDYEDHWNNIETNSLDEFVKNTKELYPTATSIVITFCL